MKSKHLIASIAVVLTGWLASSQINGVQAKYEQDVADYEAVVAGDTLPLQARMEKASPRQSIIDLSKAIQHFRKENLAVSAPVDNAKAGDSQSIVDRLLNTANSYWVCVIVVDKVALMALIAVGLQASCTNRITLA